MPAERTVGIIMSAVVKLIVISVLLVIVGLTSSIFFNEGKSRSFRSPSADQSGLKKPWGRTACYRPSVRDRYFEDGYRECSFPRDYAIEAALVSLLLLGIGFPFYRRIRIKLQSAKTSRQLAKLALTNPKWNEQFLCESAAQKFILLTQAWSRLDIETVRKLAHPSLTMEWELQFQSSSEKGEYHELKGLFIQSLEVVSLKALNSETQDQFTVCVQASCQDSLLRRGIVLKSSDEVYQEFWTFLWHSKSGWRPLQVHRADEWERFVEGKGRKAG
jgi:hypothetical protein